LRRGRRGVEGTRSHARMGACGDEGAQGRGRALARACAGVRACEGVRGVLAFTFTREGGARGGVRVRGRGCAGTRAHGGEGVRCQRGRARARGRGRGRGEHGRGRACGRAMACRDEGLGEGDGVRWGPWARVTRVTRVTAREGGEGVGSLHLRQLHFCNGLLNCQCQFNALEEKNYKRVNTDSTDQEVQVRSGLNRVHDKPSAR
jgi:hypothetical protein